MKLFDRELIRRGNGRLYLYRFILFKSAYLTIFLHQFHDSDDECPHDHPWWFVTLILWGGYLEHWFLNLEDWLTKPDRLYSAATLVRPGSLLYRPASWIHRIELLPNTKPVTLVITGPKTQTWGFYNKRNQFIPWFNYSHAEHCQ